MWGNSTNDLELRAGFYQLTYEFPTLPLRQGPYSWLLSLWDDEGQVDLWDSVPEMIVATESFQHSQDEWAGLLNLPARFALNELRNASDSSGGASGIS
jgi:hypothetical protein